VVAVEVVGQPPHHQELHRWRALHSVNRLRLHQLWSISTLEAL